MIEVLFVCMGNICRSPTAEGIASRCLRQHDLEDRIRVDSAGTHAYHVGEPPDPRSIEAAARRYIDLRDLKARRLIIEDFDRFEHILVMDQRNLDAVMELCPAHRANRVGKIMQYSSLDVGEDVPDPYYGGRYGFEQVLDLLENAVDGFIRQKFLQAGQNPASDQGALIKHV